MVSQEKLQAAFGRELRKVRLAAGFSQESLALEAGLDRTFISLLERGQRQPSLSTLFSLAETLQIQPAMFVRQVEKELSR